MRRLLVAAAVAVVVFVGLAFWNRFAAFVFGLAALTWLLAEAYRLSQGGDLFDRREPPPRD